MRFLVKIVLWLAAAVVLFSLAASLVAGYSATMSFLVSSVNEDTRADKIISLLTKDKFLFLQTFLLIISLVLILLLLKFNTAWEFTGRQMKRFKDSSLLIFRDSLPEASLILILPVLSYIFFAFYQPVYYDEASTYLSFTSRSPLVSMLYYPSYNNHILHSVITNFTSYIPFLNPLQCMRISSILASIITCMLLYSLVKKYYSANSALLVTGIVSVLSMYVYYSFASRGYGLVNLFFVLSLYSVYKIIFENNRLKHWAYFSLFSAMGFYAMPSFLYPFLTLHLALLLNNPKIFSRQLLSGSVTVLLVALLYLPVIAVNGLDVLANNNKQLHSVTRMEMLNLFPAFVSRTLTEVTGINIWFIAITSSAALLILIMQKQKTGLSFATAFILAPLILMLLNPLVPFARTLGYYCIALPLLCLIPVNQYFEKLPRLYIIVGVTVIQSALLYNFFKKMKAEKQEYMGYAEINKTIAGNNSYYLNCSLCDVTLLFELKTRDFNQAILKYTKPLADVSADTLSNYDFIIIDKNFDHTKTRVPLYSDKMMNVYGK